tara:strand:- start:765 stop:995 length:231 start_codon:yes stop_codon:yes gene_type:complete
MKKGDLVKLKGDNDHWFGPGIVVELDGSRMCKVLWSKDFGSTDNAVPGLIVYSDNDLIWNTNLEIINGSDGTTIRT